jgi:hypothetical protein
VTAPAAARQQFTDTVSRLSRQSVERRHDAYTDVPWDDPAMAVDPAHPGFELWPFDPVARTAWYRRQPPGVRRQVGLMRMAGLMRTGSDFENILQQGLLRLAYRLPNGRAEFRYLHHEVIEESQHTLMFQEFVNRAGVDVDGLPAPIKALAPAVLRLTRANPVLFFLFVLGGEEPIDHLQRRALHADGHPLVQHLMRIHTVEEARHVAFARQYLRRAVPRLGPAARTRVALTAPALFGFMARLMVHPSPQLVRTWGLPRHELDAVLRDAETRRLVADCVERPRRLCAELGLMTPAAARRWRARVPTAGPPAERPPTGGARPVDSGA